MVLQYFRAVLLLVLKGKYLIFICAWPFFQAWLWIWCELIYCWIRRMEGIEEDRMCLCWSGLKKIQGSASKVTHDHFFIFNHFLLDVIYSWGTLKSMLLHFSFQNKLPQWVVETKKLLWYSDFLIFPCIIIISSYLWHNQFHWRNCISSQICICLLLSDWLLVLQTQHLLLHLYR